VQGGEEIRRVVASILHRPRNSDFLQSMFALFLVEIHLGEVALQINHRGVLSMITAVTMAGDFNEPISRWTSRTQDYASCNVLPELYLMRTCLHVAGW